MRKFTHGCAEENATLPTTTSDAKRFIKAEDASEGSFFRAALRALVNNRKHKGLPTNGDFRLESHNGSQLFLVDDISGIVLPLNAFGPANTAVFAAFMSNPANGEGL